MSTINQYNYKMYCEIRQEYPIFESISGKITQKQANELYKVVYGLLEYKHKWDAICSAKCSDKNMEKELKMLISEIDDK